MRYVLEDTPLSYDRALATLVGFSVRARFLRNEPVWLAMDGTQPVGAAIVTLPRTGPSPEALADVRARIWDTLGPEARARYDHFGALSKNHSTEEPNHHLNMIGVRRAQAGKGIGRLLLDHVHAQSQADEASHGVTLTTEVPANVALYRHVGYDASGFTDITDTIRSWNMFRPDDRSP